MECLRLCHNCRSFTAPQSGFRWQSFVDALSTPLQRSHRANSGACRRSWFVRFAVALSRLKSKIALSDLLERFKNGHRSAMVASQALNVHGPPCLSILFELSGRRCRSRLGYPRGLGCVSNRLNSRHPADEPNDETNHNNGSEQS